MLRKTIIAWSKDTIHIFLWISCHLQKHLLYVIKTEISHVASESGFGSYVYWGFLYAKHLSPPLTFSIYTVYIGTILMQDSCLIWIMVTLSMSRSHVAYTTFAFFLKKLYRIKWIFVKLNETPLIQIGLHWKNTGAAIIYSRDPAFQSYTVYKWKTNF